MSVSQIIFRTLLNFQIYVLLCQTDLARAFNKSTILLLIRLASFNPILDPWVYILFRRELAWKLVRLWRCVFRLPPLSRPQNLTGLQKEATKTYRNGEANSSMMMANGRKQNLEDGADASCMMFCYQCLCLPPVPRASVVLSQTRGNSGRTCQGVRSSGRQTRSGKPEPSPDPDHLHSFRGPSKCSTHLFQKHVPSLNSLGSVNHWLTSVTAPGHLKAKFEYCTLKKCKGSGEPNYASQGGWWVTLNWLTVLFNVFGV